MKCVLIIVLVIVLMGLLLISCDSGGNGSGGTTKSTTGENTTYNLRGTWRVEIEVGPWSCTSGTFGGSIQVGIITFDEKGRIAGTPRFNIRTPWRNYPLWFNGFDNTSLGWTPFIYAKNGVYRGLQLGMHAVTDHYPAGQPTTRVATSLGLVIDKIKFVDQDQLRGYCTFGQVAQLGNPLQNECSRGSYSAVITLYRR